MEILRISDYQLRIEDRDLLAIKDLSLHLGEKIVLLGENGVGKTSFFKSLIGQIDDYEGRLVLNSDFVYVPQIKEASQQSGGEQMMAYLKKAFQKKPTLLLLDEPSSHLDSNNQQWLISQLLAFKGTAVVISHDRKLINDVSQKIWLIEDKTIKVYPGNYHDFQELRAREEARRLRELKSYRQKVAQLEHAILMKKEKAKKMSRRKKKNVSSSDWKVNAFAGSYDSQAKAVAKTSKVMEKRLANLPEVKDIPKKQWAKLKDSSDKQATPNTLIRLTEGQLFRKEEYLFDYPDFINRGHDKVVIKGRNKAGKSSFLEALVDHKLPGYYAQGLEISYFRQDQLNLDLDLSAFDIIQKQSNQSQHIIFNSLAMMGIDYHKAKQKITCLSGGERIRVSLVLMLLRPHHLLILDEPTNYLDLVAIEALEVYLKEYLGALLLVSHDEVFCQKVASVHYEIDQCRMQKLT
ncbi:ABC transporter, ATP-binding protein [Streptococcus ictaluri 707-05]|uniref:ABC transporter, ATP-binding protein n=2 Tax=Streptococcus ictaluri TaxID=380397 RepID=G5K0R2_9STRE|nr:ABC transporter, ATP-binding protein [Streptococcus ictaluri 707-05]